MYILPSILCAMFLIYLNVISITHQIDISSDSLHKFNNHAIDFAATITRVTWGSAAHYNKILSSYHFVLLSEIVASDLTTQIFFRDYSVHSEVVSQIYNVLNSGIHSAEQSLQHFDMEVFQDRKDVFNGYIKDILKQCIPDAPTKPISYESRRSASTIKSKHYN